MHGSAPRTPHLFVHCSGCGELVCASTVRDLGSGREHFWCHEACGHGGAIGGTIGSYSGAAGVRQQALPAPAVPTRAALPAAPKHAALPQPTRGLLKR